MAWFVLIGLLLAVAGIGRLVWKFGEPSTKQLWEHTAKILKVYSVGDYVERWKVEFEVDDGQRLVPYDVSGWYSRPSMAMVVEQLKQAQALEVPVTIVIDPGAWKLYGVSNGPPEVLKKEDRYVLKRSKREDHK